MRDWWRNRAAGRIHVEEELWAKAEGGLGFLSRLPPADRARLREMARQFIATKEWTGARGLELDARMQVSIALQACMQIGRAHV